MPRMLAELFQKAQKLKSKMSETRQKLASRHVEAESANRAVRVVASCDKQIVSVDVRKEFLGETPDPAILAELIMDTSNEALKKAEAVLKEELDSAMSQVGINLPGLF